LPTTTQSTDDKDNLEGLRARAAKGDEKSRKFLADLEAEDAKQKEIEARALAKKNEQAELERVRDKTFKERKVKTGITLITAGQSFVFEDCMAAAMNFIQDHNGDVVSIEFGIKNGTHTGMVQYTAPTEIASTVAVRLREVQNAVKTAHQDGQFNRG